MDIAHWWHVMRAWGPDTWSALANWITVFVALVASAIALRQVREARRFREERAQPYVAVYMETSPASQHFVDLVVRNFGTTIARDVRLKSTPTLMRSAGQGQAAEEVWIFDCLPTLVPGQEWRTWWDSGIERKNASLPDRYEVSVSYKDSHGKDMNPTTAILDWGAYKGWIFIELLGVHQAAKALTELTKTVSEFKELGSRGLSVVTRDGDARDARRREEREDVSRLLEQAQALGQAQAREVSANSGWNGVDRQQPTPSNYEAGGSHQEGRSSTVGQPR